ncbi:unnamed protein product [Allacma fusca]|uniref:Serpin domain-containing protein n=1 Tax=Allacma fusca TaxID=39272 RepID=A0A8J2K7E2_9HEXA|nr:unnamed protein product [Allacma fusca]
MYPFSALLFFLLPSLYFCSNEFRHHHVHVTRDKVTSEDLTSEALGALRSFNQKTVPYPFLASTNRNAVLADPLTLATFWAVVNERVFDVETEDLIKAVGLPSERIAPVYALLNNYLNQDPEFLSTTAIFSDLENTTSSSGNDKLKTYFETVDLHREGDASIQRINDYISDHTNGTLRDQLLPSQNPFSKSTRGVILSTVNYRRVFTEPLGVGPKISFQVTPEERMSVETVEIVSELKVSQDDRTHTVVIPLKSEAKKSIILVHPKNMSSFLQNDFDAFTKQVDTISRYDSTKLPYFQTRSVRVRIPAFNVTMARTLQELEQPVKIVRGI